MIFYLADFQTPVSSRRLAPEVNGEEWPVLEAGVGQVLWPGHEYGRPENKSNLSSLTYKGRSGLESKNVYNQNALKLESKDFFRFFF